MKFLAVLLFFGATHLAAQVAPPPGDPASDNQGKKSARVEGKIMNSTSGTPVGKVTLTLRREGFMQESKYIATSDADGGFLFDQVEPGRYTLYAEKPGFLRQYYGARGATGTGIPLTLSEGQLLKEILFKLTPQGIISGKVTDETGEPLESVWLRAMQWGYLRGKRVLRPVGGAVTNDLGEYRITNLSPGSYYLKALRDIPRTTGQTIIMADASSGTLPETPEEGYGDTYYPSSLDPAGATVLQVEPGSERRGVDIQFRKARVFRVRGQVVDGATGQPVTDAMVALTPALTDGNPLGMSMSLTGRQIAGGKFEVTGVLPGSYYLMAQVTRNTQTLYARQPVSVSNHNVADIVARIPGAVDVAGRVQVSGQDLQAPPQAAFRMESISIGLSAVESFGLGDLPRATAQANGSFVLRNVVPDRFRVHVWGTPPGWYLKSILVGGQERPDGTVDLTSSGSFEIMLAMGAAEVTGSVVDADDKLAPGVEVTLVPEDASLLARRDTFRVATSDQNGRFQIGNVVPGRYKLFAWQETGSGPAQDPEFLRPFESKAASIKLTENGRETVRVKAIPVEDVIRALGNRPNI